MQKHTFDNYVQRTNMWLCLRQLDTAANCNMQALPRKTKREPPPFLESLRVRARHQQVIYKSLFAFIGPLLMKLGKHPCHSRDMSESKVRVKCLSLIIDRINN